MEIEQLREAFDYNPLTGTLTWKAGRPKVRAGAVAGSLTDAGYLRVMFNGKSFKVHRLVWALQTGKWPEHTIDHVDRDRSNNAWDNLRSATQSQNLMNRPRPDSNSSGVKGVYWHKRAGKWAGQVKVGGKVHYCGLFSSLNEAKVAVEGRRELLHKEYTVH